MRRRALTDAQVDTFARDGLLANVPILSAQACRKYRADVEALYTHMGEWATADGTSQAHLHFRWAYDLATTPAILDVVEDLLGPDLLVHSTTIFRKPAHDPHFVSWHQDGHLLALSEPRFVSAWIALTESTASNGCLRVLPASHHESAPHATRRHPHNLLSTGMTVEVGVDERRAHDVEMAEGCASFHHVNLLHSSRPNRSADKRIGFAVRFMAPSVRQARWHFPVVLARGRDTSGHYEQLAAPPPDDFALSIEAQRAFVAWRMGRGDVRVRALDVESGAR